MSNDLFMHRFHPDPTAERDLAEIIGLRTQRAPEDPPVTKDQILADAKDHHLITGTSVITHENKVIATLVCGWKDYPRRGYIRDVMVDRLLDVQRHGRELLIAVIREARREKLTMLEVSSEDRPSGIIELYQSLGFVRQDTHTMTLRISS